MAPMDIGDRVLRCSLSSFLLLREFLFIPACKLMPMRIVISDESCFCFLIYFVLPAVLAYTAVTQLGRETGSRATIIFTFSNRANSTSTASLCSSELQFVIYHTQSDILIVDSNFFSTLIVTALDYIAPTTRNLQPCTRGFTPNRHPSRQVTESCLRPAWHKHEHHALCSRNTIDASCAHRTASLASRLSVSCASIQTFSN